MASIGKYNHTFFDNHPEEKDKEGEVERLGNCERRW